MSVQEKMTAIADAIRAKTGKSEALTLERMAAEIAGIQTGGDSSGVASGIYMAKITPASDTGELTVTHNLGTTDIILAACFAETLGDTVPSFAGTLSAFYAKTDIATRTGKSGYWGGNFYDTTNAYVNHSAITGSGYHSSVIDGNTFKFDEAGAAARKYMAGVTYTVIIMAASAFMEE